MMFFHFVRESFQFTMENLFHVVLVTLAWLLLLVPVVTIPGATMALYYFSRKAWLQGDTRLSDFGQGLKKYFWKGWLMALPCALLVLVLIYDIHFFVSHSEPAMRLLASIPMAAFSLLLIVQNYAWVFFVRENGALWLSIKKAFFLSASNIPFSLSLLLLTLLYFLGLYATKIGLAIVFVGPVVMFQTRAVQQLLTQNGIEF